MNNNTISKVAKEFSELMPLFIVKVIRGIHINSNPPLSPQSMHVLTFLALKDSMTMGEMAETMKILLPQLTKLIDKLVKLDLIIRERSEEDRRIVKIRLSEKGFKINEEMDTYISKMAEEKLSSLSKEDLNKFYESMKTMKEIIKKI